MESVIEKILYASRWLMAPLYLGLIVALGILVGELIKTRGMQIDRSRVEGRLAQMAANYPDPEPMLKAYRQNPEAMRQVENLVLEDQVVDYLLERARVSDQKTSFKEVMNFGA